jgi:hypothetical protein
MGKTSQEDSLKKVLAEIADKVSGLPEHLQQAAFTTLLNRSLDSAASGTGELQNLPPGKARDHLAPPTPPTDSFGEYYATFPTELSEDQKVLVAASFAEAQSSDRTYTAELAHDLLKGIGIKSTNVGVYAKRLVKPKGWAITVGKAGKKTHKFRVSNQGHKELKRLKEVQE